MTNYKYLQLDVDYPMSSKDLAEFLGMEHLQILMIIKNGEYYNNFFEDNFVFDSKEGQYLLSETGYLYVMPLMPDEISKIFCAEMETEFIRMCEVAGNMQPYYDLQKSAMEVIASNPPKREKVKKWES